MVTPPKNVWKEKHKMHVYIEDNNGQIIIEIQSNMLTNNKQSHN